MFLIPGVGRNFVTLLILGCVILGIPSVSVYTQNSTNPINLGISKVVKDGKDQPTTSVGANNWRYDGELTLDDSIKYGWSGVDLDTKYISKPTRGGGYLKIYKDDDSKSENLILEYGSSPLPVNKLSSKLSEGDNRILFVYIDSNNKASTKVGFSFKFKNTTKAPQIKVLQPTEGAVLAKEVDQDVILELKNFSLETTNSNSSDKGKVNVYFNEIKPSPNLIGTLAFSKDLGNNTFEVRFNTKDLDFAKANIPDSNQTKLIFALTKTSGEVLPYSTELIVRTNYSNSLDIGLPKISIVDPRKDRTDLKVDGDRKFILQVDNYEILAERKDGPNESNRGYLQIFIDDIPRSTVFPRTEFTLNEIGLADTVEGRKTVKVQLVNKDFTKLLPEASDSIDIIYTPSSSISNPTTEPQVENNTWRTIIVILTMILVVGGIAILITKG